MEEAAHSPRLVRFATFEVDLAAEELRKSGVRLRLTGQPFQVLAILLEHPGEMVTRDELQKRLWPDTFVDVDHNLKRRIIVIGLIFPNACRSDGFIAPAMKIGSLPTTS